MANLGEVSLGIDNHSMILDLAKRFSGDMPKLTGIDFRVSVGGEVHPEVLKLLRGTLLKQCANAGKVCTGVTVRADYVVL